MIPLYIFSCTVWFVLLKMFLVIYGNIKKKSTAPARIIITSRDSFRHFSFFMDSSIPLHTNQVPTLYSQQKGKLKENRQRSTYIYNTGCNAYWDQLMVWVRWPQSIWQQTEDFASRGQQGLKRCLKWEPKQARVADGNSANFDSLGSQCLSNIQTGDRFTT